MKIVIPYQTQQWKMYKGVISMKKIIAKFLIILIIMIIGIFYILENKVIAASIAGLNHPQTVKVGENFTVALILPENSYSAEASITVKFSDGTSSSQKLVYLKGMADFPNSVTFNAKVQGTVSISATGIVISDASSNEIENGGSKEGSLTVSGGETTPTQNSTPTVNFKDASETVYTTSRCNIRESYSTDSKKLGTVNIATSLKRTGISDNGWSRIEYNGKTAYVSSEYLSTNMPEVKFSSVNDTLYAKQDCNVRKSWTTDSDKVGYLTKGQEVIRIGIGENGWSKIEYDGKQYYVSSSLLTDTDPSEVVNEVNNIVNNTVNENIVGNEVEKTELETLQEKIGVMPEVGNNTAIKLYIVVSMITLIVISVGLYYINVNKRDV